MKYKLLLLLTCMVTLSFGQITYWEKSVVKEYEEGVNLYGKQIFAAASDKFNNVMEAVSDKKCRDLCRCRVPSGHVCGIPL